MNNWKTPAEAKELQFAMLRPASINQQAHAVLCDADQCGHWLWRPCKRCNGNGVIPIDKNPMKFGPENHVPKWELIDCNCCNGTGHDGSGLGRCGLIRG